MKKWMGKWAKLSGKQRLLVFLAVYSVLFLATFLLAYSPFLYNRKSLNMDGDGSTQYYAALFYIGEYWRQIISSLFCGRLEIPLFDPSLGFGGDIIGTLNYYGFGDPLTLLSVAVPRRYTEYLYCAMIVLRFYLAGLSFCALCVSNKKRVSHALIGSMIYVFSGHMVFYGVKNLLFANPMIQFPLLILGADRIIEKKKPGVFIAGIAYAAMCGFYFFYIMTVLLVVYVAIRLAGSPKQWLKTVFTGVVSYLEGVCLAGIIFFPSVFAFLSSSRSASTAENNLLWYGLPYYAKNFLGVITPRYTNAGIAVAAIVLFALALLVDGAIRKKERRGLFALLIVACVIYVVPLCSYVLHAFTYPTPRWIFAMSLLLSYITVEMLPELLALTKRHRLICLGVVALYGAAVFAVSAVYSFQLRYAVAAVMLALTAVVLLIQRHVLAVCFLVVVNVGFNTAYYNVRNEDGIFKDFLDHGAQTSRTFDAVEFAFASNDAYNQEFGRLDGTTVYRNYGAIAHYPTVRAYWSVTNGSVYDYFYALENIDMCTSSRFEGADGRTAFSTLLSNRYFVTKKNEKDGVPFGYTLVAKKNGRLIYENEYALPLGYTYSGVLSQEALDGLNGIEKQDALMQKIVLDGSQALVEEGGVTISAQAIPYTMECKDVSWKDEILNVKKAGGKIVLHYELPEHSEEYVRFEGLVVGASQSNLKISLKDDAGGLKSTSAQTPSFSRYNGLTNLSVNLGYSDQKRSKCTITFKKKGKYKLADIQLYTQPMDRYQEQAKELGREALTDVSMRANRICGSVELSENKILCVSIPYSKGWSATVDGKKVDVLRGNYMFLAIPLEAGRHEIVLRYFSPGLLLGIASTVIGIAAAFLYRRKVVLHSDRAE